MRNKEDVVWELEDCQDLWQKEFVHKSDHDGIIHPRLLEFRNRLDERGRVLDWVFADSNKGASNLPPLRDVLKQYFLEAEKEEQMKADRYKNE